MKSLPLKVSSRLLIYGCLFAWLFFLLVLVSVVPPLFDLVLHLMTGWLRHLLVNVPHIGWDLTTITLGLVSGLVATFLTHRLIRYFRGSTWTLRRTLTTVGLFLAATAAAVGMTGIVHELAWLARTPIFESSRATGRVMAMNNGKQLWLAMLEAEHETGAYPASMEQLVEWMQADPHDGDSHWDLTTYQVPGSTIKQQFVLLQPGRNMSELPAKTPLLAAFGFPDARCLVIFNDGLAKTMSNGTLNQLLDEQPWNNLNQDGE